MAVYWAYFSCPDGFNSYLSSLPRYLQLPFRLLHFVGPLMLAMIGLKYAMRYEELLKRRAVTGLIGVFIILFASQQFIEIKNSFATIQSPKMGKAENYARIIPVEIESLLSTAKSRGIDIPNVLMLYSYWEHLPSIIAHHHGLQKSPDDLRSDKPLARWRLNHIRFDTNKPDFTTGDVVLQPGFFDKYDILWPLDGSDQISQEIKKLTNNQDCISDPSKYFLFRTVNGPNGFICIPKAKPN
jgi:hypothetical protein